MYAGSIIFQESVLQDYAETKENMAIFIQSFIVS